MKRAKFPANTERGLIQKRLFQVAQNLVSAPARMDIRIFGSLDEAQRPDILFRW